ncbi:MAG: hypothetical protein ABMB14_33600 [Myxococcota bacterium]
MRMFILSPCLLVACTARVKFDDINIDAQVDDVDVDGTTEGPGTDPDDGTSSTDGTEGGGDSGSEGTTDGTEWTDTATESAGPLEVYSSELTCIGEDEVEYTAIASGAASEVWLFQQETGNNPPNWSENHTLELVSDGDDAVYERLLLDGSGIEYDLFQQEQDYSTLFDCQDFLTAPGVMSFAVALIEDGEIADCIAYGADPRVMIDGTQDRVNEPVFDLTNCRIVAQ